MPTEKPMALEKVAGLLKSEDDLAKIDTLLGNLSKEKSTIGSQMKLEQERGMNGIQEMINSMQAANKLLKELELSVQKVKELQKESTGNKEVSSVFNNAATALKNFGDVEKIYGNFKTLSSKMDLIEELMTMEVPPDSDYYSETSSGDNLLLIHFELNSLRDFKDEACNLAASSSPDIQQAIEGPFERLDKLISRFDEMIALAVDGFIDIMNCENYGFIIKLVRIIQYEEREDIKLKLLNTILNGTTKRNEDEPQKPETYVKRTSPRGYKAKFEADFQKTINSSLEMIFTSHDQADALNMLEENYYDTLELYRRIIDKCFPPDWNFFHKILDWNQQSLGKLILKQLDDDSVSNNEVVRLLNFEYDNKQRLKKQFNIKGDELQQISLLSKKKLEELLDSCLEFNKSKTSEWIDNSLGSAIDLFCTRSKEPPDSIDGKLGIETAQNIIEILHSNIKALTDLGDSRVLVDYLKFFGENAMNQYYKKWDQTLSSEVKKWTIPGEAENDPMSEDDPTIGYMPRYITILANDCVKLVDALDKQYTEVKKLVHKSFYDQLTQSSTEASKYAIALGTDCLEKLNGFIKVEYKPFLHEVFSKQWYKSSSMIEYSLQIVDESYMGPLQEFLHPELYISLFEIVFDQYLLAYLNALLEGHKIKQDKFAEKIERDGNLMQETFSKFDKASIVPDQLYILDILINLSECDDIDEYASEWKSSVLVFNDLPSDFIRVILKNKGIRKSKVQKIVARCIEESKAVAAENGDDQAPTFMSQFRYTEKDEDDYTDSL